MVRCPSGYGAVFRFIYNVSAVAMPRGFKSHSDHNFLARSLSIRSFLHQNTKEFEQLRTFWNNCEQPNRTPNNMKQYKPSIVHF